jgi:hypothetical protein
MRMKIHFEEVLEHHSNERSLPKATKGITARISVVHSLSW